MEKFIFFLSSLKEINTLHLSKIIIYLHYLAMGRLQLGRISFHRLVYGLMLEVGSRLKEQMAQRTSWST
jgi:hypothetical protein